jgi:hypothetical protein
MRKIPAELAARYEAEGWWTADTLGSLLAPGLAVEVEDLLLGMPGVAEVAVVAVASARRR